MFVSAKKSVSILVAGLLFTPCAVFADQYLCDDGSIVSSNECPDGGIAHIIPEEIRPRSREVEPIRRFQAEEIEPFHAEEIESRGPAEPAQAAPQRQPAVQTGKADAEPGKADASQSQSSAKRGFVRTWNAYGTGFGGFGSTIFYGEIVIKPNGQYSHKGGAGAYSIQGGKLTFTSGPLAPNVVENIEGDRYVMKWTKHPEYSWWGLWPAE